MDIQSQTMGLTPATILCCSCSVPIEQNALSMCVNCLRHEVDITDGINRQMVIHSCRSCGRFLCPPWANVALESKELLAACLRKIPGLKELKLIDAVWIWTEPHSRRLKIKLTVQKEVMNGAVLQQAAIVEFIIRNQQCKNCEASYAQGVWHAVVQVRQRVTHKRTFFYLEQLLLKHHAHNECINIVTFKDGMDFYFKDRQPAVRFIDFLETHIPTRSKYRSVLPLLSVSSLIHNTICPMVATLTQTSSLPLCLLTVYSITFRLHLLSHYIVLNQLPYLFNSRKLVSHDARNGTADFKHNYLIEIVPVCKDDLISIPPSLARNLSDINPLCLVKTILGGIHVIDPRTGERQEISAEKYWRQSFTPLQSSRELVRFIVIDIEPILQDQRATARKISKKVSMAEVTIAREDEFGVTDTQCTVLSHLGNILRVGDLVMGFDLTRATWAQEHDASQKSRGALPDVILVRKYYPPKADRIFTLKELEVDELMENVRAYDEKAREADYDSFLQEIQGDKEMRSKINLYKNTSKSSHTMDTEEGDNQKTTRGARKEAVDTKEVDGDEGSDMDEEEVQLDELLDDLNIEEQEWALRDNENVVVSKEHADSIQELAVPPSETTFDHTSDSTAGLKEGGVVESVFNSTLPAGGGLFSAGKVTGGGKKKGKRGKK